MVTIIPPSTIPSETIAKTVATLRSNFMNNVTRSYEFRERQLAGLAKFLKECESQIESALYQDIGKPAAETLAAEIGMVATELNLTRRQLSSWMKVKRVSTPLLAQPGYSRIYSEPLGVVLIIAPWNYPIQITLLPLVGALAAGNCVVIKPSELAPATSRLLATLLPNYIDPQCLRVIEGGVPETTAILNEHFDYICYTGSGAVGRIVMTAAAKHLTPVTLELGGKSPCIVDDTTDLKVAARRIAWGKFSNAGQSCVAPDYILVFESVEEALLTHLKKAVNEFYGDHPKASPDYGRIISTNHYHRLMNLIPGSGQIYLGGEGVESERYIPPTILRDVPRDAPAMQEEIFGPILPVITIKSIDDAIQFINSRSKPLALYLFSENNKTRKKVIEKTSSGSMSINYPMLQLTVPSLPFGGVGESGMGAYHGKATFDMFSHRKSVLTKPTWIDLSILYPPYSSLYKKLVRWLMLG